MKHINMVRFKMLGLDVNSAPLDRGPTSAPTQYRTWVVNDEPDFTGQFYTGEKSGPNPLVNITAYAIFDPNEVVNFNLPDPTDWGSTFSTMPVSVYDSQLAVIDGYAYLFGGLGSNVIWQASLNTPTVWVDTGARLPVTLAGSQLAIVGTEIFLFGGQTGLDPSTTTNIALSATVSSPLNWTNNGPVLPAPLSHSQLSIVNNTIYLFGGFQNGTSSNVIYSAPVASPLTWSNTGSTLVDPLSGSQLGIMDGYICLMGGVTSPNNPTANVYGAALSNPNFWFLIGALPAPAFNGQFCTIGQQGYLFTPASLSASGTRIFQCNISSPSMWIDTLATIPGTVSQSQLAIIYDRIWLFGGNGSSVIFANDSILKYNLNDVAVTSYGNITRTQYQSSSPLNLFQVIGFPAWKTDYGTV